MESLGRDTDRSNDWRLLFHESGVEEVVLPSTLREARSDIFEGCSCLKVVRVARGCAVNVRKLVGFSVKVKRQ